MIYDVLIKPLYTPIDRYAELGVALIKGNSVKSDRAGFEEVDHTADVALRIWAPNFEALLCQAALGMTRLMYGSITSGQVVRKRFSLEAFDRESLLVEWLGELAYSAEINREVFYEFGFECVTDCRLIAAACGNRVDSLQTVIKAVTYHNLKIIKTDRGLEATVVFDV